MAINDIVQTIAEARVDARSLSDFVFKPAGFKVARRLAPPVDTLQFYINRFNNLNGDFSSSVSVALSSLNNSVAEADGKVAYIETTVQDAINNTAVDGGVLADTFVTATPQGVGMVAQNLREVLGESISVKRFGAKGNGVTDDSVAITKAITYAIANKIKLIFPAGTYLISTWTTVSALTLLHIEGDGRDVTVIKGTGADQQIMFAKLNNVRIKGITFEDMKSVAYYSSDGVERWDIESFTILECGFRRIGLAIYQFGQRGLATLYTAKNVHILGNLVEDCGGGIVIYNNIIVYSAAHNVLRRIGEQYRFHKDVVGIGLGRDTMTTNDVSRLQGLGVITHNLFEDFVTTEPAGNKGVCNFFQIFSNNIIISQNIGTRLKNTNPLESDQEATYCKGRKCLIENNSFTDAGGYESVIRVKGVESLKPDLTIVRHNFIEFKDQTVGRRIGIMIDSGNCAVYGNNLKGCGAQGITIQNMDLNTNHVSVYNNIIDDMNNTGTGVASCYGVYVLGNIPNIYIKDNHISFSTITNSLACGVICETLYIADSPDINNLHIQGNKSYSDSGVSGTTGSFRSVRHLNLYISVEMLKITDNSAYVINSTRTVMGTSISVPSHTVKNLLFTGNSLITGDNVTTIAMELVGTVANKTIANNIGYPTLDAVQKGVTTKRPTLPSLGDVYYDTTLLPSGKPITWNGNEWVDALGDVV